MADETLYAKQVRIYPQRVSGIYRNLKWVAMIVCLAIYYCVPFLRWDRGENAPDQAVLIDLERGRAYWFWIEIWPQEVYILTGILIFAAIALFFVTSLFGRVWCGYLCFQTVWTDLFVWVERIVQGDRNKRKRLREGPWTFEKIIKLSITHFIWLVIAWWTAGSFVLYFNDAPTLVKSFFTGEVSTTVLAFIGGLTFSTYLMAGFAREQVCTYMCPYARFQSAMFDKDTLIVGYNEKRGEPRGKLNKTEGDCIDCKACVNVCPMGIDIRDGLQMECIACGLCIDACDNIMEKVDLPKGLIAYDSERRVEERANGQTPSPIKFIRPRTIYYSIILALVGGFMITVLLNRPSVELTVLHDRNPLFVQLSDGQIRNGYEIKILNKTHDDHVYRLTQSGIDNATLSVKSAGDVTADELFVAADSVGHYRVQLSADVMPQEQRDIVFELVEATSNHKDTYESVFITRK